jgi:hypothetical protein
LAKLNISRREFIQGTVEVAGVAMAGTSALMSAETPEGTSQDSGECSINRLEQASKGYKPRYPGPRWHLIYGAYSGVEEFALNELQATTQRYLPRQS